MKVVLLVAILFGIVLGQAETTIWPKLEDLFTGGCGDGLIQKGEQCDDFNRFDGDGCDHKCRLEYDSQFLGGAGILALKNWVQTPTGPVATSNARIELFLRLNAEDVNEIDLSDLLPGGFGGGGLPFPIPVGPRVEAVPETPFDSQVFQDFKSLIFPTGSNNPLFKNSGNQNARRSTSSSSSDDSDSSDFDICGDGFIGKTEQCDDFNSDDTDGCANCRVSAGYYCNNVDLDFAVQAKNIGELDIVGSFLPGVQDLALGTHIRSTTDCTNDVTQVDPSDGGGFGFFGYLLVLFTGGIADLQTSLNAASRNITRLRESRGCWETLPGNECLDGNNKNGDGCDENCQIEDGYVCFSTAAYASLNTANFQESDDYVSGNGIAFLANDICVSEAFLAANPPPPLAQNKRFAKGKKGKKGKDGRDSRNRSSKDDSSKGSSFEAESICGNKIVEGDEQCDDGNIFSDDGCSRRCRVEPGYICYRGDITIVFSRFGNLGVPGYAGSQDTQYIVGGSTCTDDATMIAQLKNMAESNDIDIQIHNDEIEPAVETSAAPVDPVVETSAAPVEIEPESEIESESNPYVNSNEVANMRAVHSKNVKTSNTIFNGAIALVVVGVALIAFAIVHQVRSSKPVAQLTEVKTYGSN